MLKFDVEMIYLDRMQINLSKLERHTAEFVHHL